MSFKKSILLVSTCLLLLSTNLNAESEKECFEKISRGIFKFNKILDKNILRPVAAGFNKLPDPGKADCRKHSFTKDKKEVTVYFQPSPTARKICVKHLNDAVDLNQLYTPQVLTEDVLKLIEPQVVAKFNYGDELEQEELSDIITETTVDDVTENS